MLPNAIPTLIMFGFEGSGFKAVKAFLVTTERRKFKQ